ncbi:Osmoprotectant ABC transporter binding proteinYehZ [Salmonella enterica subsp. enterica]|nr:Osmoprotectant ABC transporter binding proteinYehZ [Salmonella enterica subsp. enterica]
MTISKLWVSSLALLATVSLPLQAGIARDGRVKD